VDFLDCEGTYVEWEFNDEEERKKERKKERKEKEKKGKRKEKKRKEKKVVKVMMQMIIPRSAEERQHFAKTR